MSIAEHEKRAHALRRVGSGQPWPLGMAAAAPAAAAAATDQALALNVAVWAPDAEAVELCVFDASGQHERQRLPLTDRSDGVWHAALVWTAHRAERERGLVYGWRVHGVWHPAEGHRFNPAKILLDPWAREIVGRYAGDLDLCEGHQADDPSQPCHRNNAAAALKARWRERPEGDHRPALPPRRVSWPDTVLYEAHVKGLTQRHPDIPAELRGRYAALAHPVMLAHYRRLGITTLSLLPVHARADEARLQGLGLTNYWGYSSIAFLAPEPRYACATGPDADIEAEFKAMVDALHAAGLEVVLDVVFNHTAETDEAGPTLSLRGLANARYYRLRHGDRARYENWTGCGNCLDLTQPRVLELVLGSLRHWVQTFGVDGYRFDLAPVLARDAKGHFDPHAPFLAAMQADPVLSRVKWVAEPWDIGPGGYQLGGFPPGWREWNDRFRDDLRDWWLSRHAGGQGATRGALAHRIAASSAQFHHSGRAPDASVNFITAHDGFTLRDLVSYQAKHNQANGEHNRDGHGHNRSWNVGVEGPAEDAEVHRQRLTLSRSLLASLLLAQGTPMLLAGDELGHTQGGNNNAYCQDNDTTWLDWTGPDADDLSATVARLTALRRRHPGLRLPHWWTGRGDVRWLAPDAQPLVHDADWHGTEGTLTVEFCDPGGTLAVWLLFNAERQARRFRLPAAAAQAECVFDSACAAGAPIAPGDALAEIAGAPHAVQVWLRSPAVDPA